LVLALDAANNKSYPRIGTVWSSGWAGSFSNPTYSFDGNLSTATIQNGTATYTFAGGGLSVSGTVRIYVTFGASSGQVAGLPNVIVVDGTDVSSKMAAANVYTTGVGAGWIDITSEVGAVFNTIVMTGTGGRSNPSIYAVEVDGQILIDAVAATSWTDLSGNNNTGTLTNGPTFSNVNGGTIVFDGVDDYVIDDPTINMPLGSSSRTICVWAYLNNYSSNVFIHIGTNSSGQKYIFQVYTSDFVYIFTDGVNNNNNVTITDVQRPTLNVWNHLTFKNEGQNYEYFLNGISQKTGTFSTTLNTVTQRYLIGKRDDVATGTLNGRIATLSVYNRALSATEVLQNYNAVKSRFGL